MKGLRFYAELPEARTSKTARMVAEGHDFEPFTRASIRRWADKGGKLNVVAVILDERGSMSFLPGGRGDVEALVSVYDHDNSPVSLAATSRDYLRTRATRIDEATARKLHPALFQRIDD